MGLKPHWSEPETAPGPEINSIVFQVVERIARFTPHADPEFRGLRKECRHDLGVKLRPRKFLDFRARRFNRHGLTVRAVGSHGVHSVGHGEYSCSQRDLLALQSARIAAAVIKLLVREN